jgi:hypothetical protein
MESWLALHGVATESQATDKEWHRCKQNEHGQIDRTGDWIAAADIVAKRTILECHGEQEFGCNQQGQGKQAGAQTNRDGRRQVEPLRDEARSQTITISMNGISMSFAMRSPRRIVESNQDG